MWGDVDVDVDVGAGVRPRAACTEHRVNARHTKEHSRVVSSRALSILDRVCYDPPNGHTRS